MANQAHLFLEPADGWVVYMAKFETESEIPVFRLEKARRLDKYDLYIKVLSYISGKSPKRDCSWYDLLHVQVEKDKSRRITADRGGDENTVAYHTGRRKTDVMYNMERPTINNTLADLEKHGLIKQYQERFSPPASNKDKKMQRSYSMYRLTEKGDFYLHRLISLYDMLGWRKYIEEMLDCLFPPLSSAERASLFVEDVRMFQESFRSSKKYEKKSIVNTNTSTRINTLPLFIRNRTTNGTSLGNVNVNTKTNEIRKRGRPRINRQKH